MVLIINKKSKKEDFDKFIFERKNQENKGFDAKKYSGVIKSFINFNPNKIQDKLRNEW